jgi:uncharacterized protein (DUF608 family)
VCSFEAQLWTGTYYRAARQSDGSTYDACIAGQLNGQWYAHLLGLGYVVAPERVRQAVETMLRLNGSVSRFGAVNAVFPDGRLDTSSWHSGNIWAGETYALSALAIYEGFVDEGLDLAKRMWMSFVDGAKRPWSQTDVVSAQDGRPGDGEFYIRNIAIWAVLLALAQGQAEVRDAVRALVPALPMQPIRARSRAALQPASS